MENKKNILDVVSISGLRVKKFEGERGYLSTGDLDFNKIANIELVSYENKPSRANQNVNVGEVIFAKMKDTKKTLVIDEESKDIIVSTGFYVLKPSKQILSKYLYHYLNSDYFLNQKNKLSKGATQCALNNEGLSNITIYMYNLETQKKIVEILDKAQELIDKRKVQIEILDLLVKSKFIEMFGDLEHNINKFNKVKMKEICNKITDGTHKTPNYLNEGIKFISAKDIKTGKLDLTNTKYISVEEYYEIQKRCQLENGDILLSKSGSIGTPVVLDVDEPLGIFESLAVLKIKNNIVNNIYVCEFLRSYSAQRKILFGTKGISIKHLHLNVLRELEILIPPIELQNKFADFAKQVDKLKFEMEKSLKELEDNFNSLMQKAFKGKLFI
ncbi:restriction endonuclease subunit S [Clostridium perfringens]|nr:restriction endonuclease subunit S [Clostridium perfringens]